MRYLRQEQAHLDAESGDDTASPTEYLEQQLRDIEEQKARLKDSGTETQQAQLMQKSASILADLDRGAEAYTEARQAFDIFIASENWEQAVLACDTMFRSDQADSLAALGQGVWLAVTFPIDPELTVEMLSHIIEETPNESDGGAVAAAVAHYIADMRSSGKQHEELTLFTNNLLAKVARRHSDVLNQAQFDYWLEKLELSDPQKFLVRLRNVIDVLVQDNWWVDQDAVWSKLPPQD